MNNRPSDIVRELRYVALNRTIEETGYRNLMGSSVRLYAEGI